MKYTLKNNWILLKASIKILLVFTITPVVFSFYAMVEFFGTAFSRGTYPLRNPFQDYPDLVLEMIKDIVEQHLNELR